MINLNFNVIKSISDPFNLVVFDEFLNKEVYNKIKANFPQANYQLMKGNNFKYQIHSHAKNDNNNVFEKVINEKVILRDFYNYLQTKEFYGTICEFFPILHDARIKHTNLEFSYLPANGGFILPHTDTSKKLVTIVIYFPFNWQKEWGGEFCAHSHSNKEIEDFTDLSMGKIEYSDLTDIYCPEFVDNRGVVMQRSNKSIHSVKKISGPEGVFRTSLTMNIIGKKID